jgi:glycosyltransferase involved in cell wall biosynthesis
MHVELTAVMPVYNEEGCIAGVVTDWIETLRKTGASFRLLVLNDGSRDGTLERLKSVSAPELVLVDKKNEGHGPTILRGYSIAVGQSEWVFQADSDDELPSGSFPDFWAIRDSYDMIFGVREKRGGPPARRLLSAASRACVMLLCGRGAKDVNVPYRLMRARCLAPMLSAIPAGTFAPNVAIAGMAVKDRLRLANVPVVHRRRRTGVPSLARWRLVRSAARSLVQTVRILRKCRTAA